MFTFTRKRLPAFCESRSGNVSMMFALALPVLIFGVAFAVDFTNATIVKTKLNAAADAAALAALTPAMMQESTGVAQAAAQAMFTAQASTIATLVQPIPTPQVTFPTISGGGSTRKVQVTYNVENKTLFGTVLAAVTGGTNEINIQGTSSAQASIPPNINFYLLLDNSPSMALPATQAGLSLMQNLTSKQGGGCAFACHQASTNNGDTAGNLCTTGGKNPVYSSPTSNNNQYCAATNRNGQPLTQLDNFGMARYNKIQLRLDELSTGVADMMTTAYNNQNSGLYATPPTYQFAAYTMDTSWQIGMKSYSSPASPTNPSALLMAMTSSYQSAWDAAKANLGVMEMYSNNNVCGSLACTSSGGNGDVATSFSNALETLNKTMPNPGNGTNVVGDKPQEVLFLVTDGVEDDVATSCSQAMASGNRCQATIDPSLCTAIKNRGIKIAVLYTKYLQVPSNTWYDDWISIFQPDIGTQLKACAWSETASSEKFYVEADFDTNLGAALSHLFSLSVQQATLVK